MATSKTSEAKAKIALDSAAFEKGAKVVINAANAMSSAVTAAFAAAGVAILAAFGAQTVGSIIHSLKSVIDLGESMANAGKRAGIAAGQFYLFNAAVEKGLGMKTVAGLIGENAEVLNRSAGIFRDVAIKLWAIGEKIRGFWLGLMDRVAPVLSRILDGSLGVSLVSAGQWFGDKIADAVEIIYQLAKDGNLWDTLKQGLQVAFDYAGERLVWMGKVGYEILRVLFSRAFADGITDGVSSIWDYIKSFTKDLGEQVGYAFFHIWAKVTEMANNFLNTLDKALNAAGLLSDKELKTKVDARNRETDATNSVAGVTPEPAKGDNVLEKIQDILKNNKFQGSEILNSQIEGLQNKISSALSGYKRDEKDEPTKHFENNTRQAAFGADSLTAIGGGGGVYLGLSVLDVNKAQLSELRSINMRLGNLGGNSQLTVNNLQAAQSEISRAQTSSAVN